MVEASPKVPIDSPHSLSVPTLPSSLLLLSFAKPQFNTDKSTHYANTILNSQAQKALCTCPQILVCDDDSFQTMYYKLLFEGLKDCESSKKKAPKFELFESGEELVQRYLKMKKCGCGSLQLAITDYNMGPKKMNGVDTIINLRRNGYTEQVMLRTSETQEYLGKRHPKFNQMIESGFINCFQEKNHVKETKAMIQKLFKLTN